MTHKDTAPRGRRIDRNRRNKERLTSPSHAALALASRNLRELANRGAVGGPMHDLLQGVIQRAAKGKYDVHSALEMAVLVGASSGTDPLFDPNKTVRAVKAFVDEVRDADRRHAERTPRVVNARPRMRRTHTARAVHRPRTQRARTTKASADSGGDGSDGPPPEPDAPSPRRESAAARKDGAS